MNDVRTILSDPGDVALPMPTKSHPEWEGMALAEILEAAPEEGERLLEFLANGYDGPFGLKLAAALMLGRREVLGPYRRVRALETVIEHLRRDRSQGKKREPADGLSGKILKKTLIALRKATRKDVSLHALRCVLVDQGQDSLVLRTTDLRTWMRFTFPFGTDEEPWQALVEAKPRYDGVRGIGCGKSHPASLSCDGGFLEVAGVRATVKARDHSDSGKDEDKAPPWPQGEVVGSVHNLDLDLLAAVAMATAKTDDGRPVLQHVCVEADGTIVAADGHRLFFAPSDAQIEFLERRSEEEGDGEENGKRRSSLLVPAEAVEVAAYAMESIAEARLEVITDADGEQDQVIVLSGPAKVDPVGRVEIVAHLLDGRFPNFRDIIPHDHVVSTVCQVDVGEAHSFATGLKKPAVKVGYLTALHLEDGVLGGLVPAAGGASVAAQAQQEVLRQNGRTIWAANIDYVADALKALKDLGVEVATLRVGPVRHEEDEYEAPSVPFFIEDGEVSDGLRCLVMPMHLGERDFRDLVMSRWSG